MEQVTINVSNPVERYNSLLESSRIIFAHKLLIAKVLRECDLSNIDNLLGYLRAIVDVFLAEKRWGEVCEDPAYTASDDELLEDFKAHWLTSRVEIITMLSHEDSTPIMEQLCEAVEQGLCQLEYAVEGSVGLIDNAPIAAQLILSDLSRNVTQTLSLYSILPEEQHTAFKSRLELVLTQVQWAASSLTDRINAVDPAGVADEPEVDADEQQ